MTKLLLILAVVGLAACGTGNKKTHDSDNVDSPKSPKDTSTVIKDTPKIMVDTSNIIDSTKR